MLRMLKKMQMMETSDGSTYKQGKPKKKKKSSSKESLKWDRAIARGKLCWETQDCTMNPPKFDSSPVRYLWTIWHVIDQESKASYAVKVISKHLAMKLGQTENICRERRILLGLKHPFIVRMYKTDSDMRCVYLYQDFVNGGSLTLLHKMQAEFKDEIIQFYAAQIALALDYIHSKGIIYLNVKMDNVMIGKDGYLKLIDFHKAKKLYKIGKTNTTIGNPTYTAPEILEGKIYDSSPDWWAFGILLYELHYGSPPFA